MPELKSSVLVLRSLLEEVIYDGCCPLHLRLQLGRLLSVPATIEPVPLTVDMGGLLALNRPCLEAVAGYLPLADVLSVRSCSEEQLQWAMQPEAEERSPQHLVHDRIRTRLCMQRISDLTAGTTDESIFETRLRSLADEAQPHQSCLPVTRCSEVLSWLCRCLVVRCVLVVGGSVVARHGVCSLCGRWRSFESRISTTPPEKQALPQKTFVTAYRAVLVRRRGHFTAVVTLI